MEGWIKVHRRMLDHWIWQEKPFSRGQAWVDLLLLVNHDEKKVLFDGKLVSVSRGHKITSLRQLSERWGWSTNKIKKFLEQLKNDKMLDFKCDKKKTLIAIDSYSVYQGMGNTEETPKKQRSDSEVTQKKTNKNVEEIKEVKIYEQEVENLWLLYPRKKGKDGAFNKLPKLIKKYGYAKIESCVKRYAQEVKGKNETYIQYGSTFFNTGYADYLEENKPIAKDDGFEEYLWTDEETGEQEIRKRKKAI